VDDRRRDPFENPYPILAELREAEPLVADRATGGLYATRYEDVKTILKDRDLSKDPRRLPADDPLRARLATRQPSMLFLDPPDHTRLRSLVAKAFTPLRVQKLAPRVEAITAELLAAADGHATFDLVAVLAKPQPIRVIAELIGIDVAATPEFADWCDAMSHEFNPAAPSEALRRAGEARTAFDALIRQTMAARRLEPRDDLVTALLAAEEEGDRLSESELVSMCRVLLLAGNVTTTDMIGNAVLALLDHPAELERLRGDMGLLDRAVEEMLRYDSSVTGVGRNVVEEAAVVAGRSLLPGAKLHVSVAAANHDPRVFAEPERFAILRPEQPHLAFGTGIHVCIGAALARLEVRTAIRAVLERYPRLRLAVPRSELRWRRVVFFRGLERLPIAVD
jgi:cytochrome P450